jgi:hypothetical protein
MHQPHPAMLTDGSSTYSAPGDLESLPSLPLPSEPAHSYYIIDMTRIVAVQISALRHPLHSADGNAEAKQGRHTL